MTDEEQIDSMSSSTAKRRTWADVFVSTSYLLAGLLFLILSGLAIYYIFGKIPNWFYIAIIGSMLFIPFLFDRARDGAELLIVSENPFQLTEYRIGKNTGLTIDGAAVSLISRSGTNRKLLTDFDIDTLVGKGSKFADIDQIDQMRDLSTLQRLTQTLEETLRESRISSQEVGIEVEKRSIEIVDWALKTIYGAIIPTEISEAFGIDEKEKTLDVDTGLDSLEVEEI